MAVGHDLLVARGTSLQAPIMLDTYRKASAPTTGDKYGTWGPDGMYYSRLPGGSVLTFDLSKLTLQDYRQMRDDYQLNASLNVLMFLMATADWSIECENQKIADELEEGLRDVWFPLVRALSQAFWAGFSPTVKVYELNDQSKTYRINNFKDLIPEQSRVHWQTTRPRGINGPTIYTYDGIDFGGDRDNIPGNMTMWYPLLMENGNYYGRKLLKPAFPSWFFSQLMHLFTNRYFERFGEPTAVGYYPPDDTVIGGDGTSVSGRDLMEQTLSGLRSRGVVTLPSDTDDKGNHIWDIKFLESQMRGVDFDRYIARLDEEKSLALFTPVLLFRTGEKGSYNLGAQHMQVFQWMLNALLGDWKHYLDLHVIKDLKDINFGPNAPKAQIRFRQMGHLSDEGAYSILQALIQNQGAKLAPAGLADLGSYLGLGLEEVQQLTTSGDGQPPGSPPPTTDPRLHPGVATAGVQNILRTPPRNPAVKGNQAPARANPGAPPSKFLRSAYERMDKQIGNLFTKGGDVETALSGAKVGFKGAFLNAMNEQGASEPAADALFTMIQTDVTNALTGSASVDEARTALKTAFAAYGITDD